MNYEEENITGAALLRQITPDQAEAMLTVFSAVKVALTCPECGEVLGAESAVVLELPEKYSPRRFRVWCPACAPYKTGGFACAAAKGFRVHHGRELAIIFYRAIGHAEKIGTFGNVKD